MEENREVIIGRYKHYKGRRYDVYCVAHDSFGEKLVLYKQCYGNHQFWLRPLDMFFDTIMDGDISVQRFSLEQPRKGKSEKRIEELIELLSQNKLTCIKHSETENSYLVTNIDYASKNVLVYPAKGTYGAGYLSRFELAKRMGVYACQINNEMHYFDYPLEINEQNLLKIGNNDINALVMSPCSIDLQIADSGYLSSKRKTVDPQSIEHVTRASELWKAVKIYNSKNSSSSYFKLPPGKTVLTHTKERIKIPNDCAGKIEIKSTYARLSLSITSGDFCNPGYDGFFPLEITNYGKHTIIIHTNLAMAQLMLVPLQGPILESYDSLTFRNAEGFDDGTPYTFWRERSIKSIRQASGSEKVVACYKKLRAAISATNTNDVNAFRERFDNNFLPFCQRQINKSRRQDRNNGRLDALQLLKMYILREKKLKSIFKIKWASAILAIICAVIPVILPYIIGIDNTDTEQIGVSFRAVLQYWPWFVGALFLLVVTLVLYINTPKIFCTFENIDLEVTLEVDD